MLAALLLSTTPVSVAAPSLSPANLKPEVASFYSDHFASQLALEGVRVVTQSEIAALIGLERQKQLLGCTETSCIAELGNALGVDALVTGSIGQFGSTLQANIKIVGAVDGRQLALVSVRAGGEAEMLDELAKAARTAANQVSEALGRPIVTSESARRPSRAWAMAPGVVGVAGLGAFAFFVSNAAGKYTALSQPSSTLTYPAAQALAEQGQLQQTLAGVALAVGVVAVALAVWLLAWGS